MRAGVPASAAEVLDHLGGLARRLDELVSALEAADREATEKRRVYDLAFSKAFLSAEGSMDVRRHQAVLATEAERAAADVADTVVRHLRRQIDAVKTRIDVGRSYSAALRAEITLGAAGDQ